VEELGLEGEEAEDLIKGLGETKPQDAAPVKDEKVAPIAEKKETPTDKKEE
jgi:hypothetical protein